MKKISMAAARVDAGYSQKEMASKLGITREYYNELERGKRPIRERYVILLCYYTGFNPEDLRLPSELMEE